MVSIAILAIGIANQPRAMAGVFVAYICINFVSNAWSFSVQLGMVLITLQKEFGSISRKNNFILSGERNPRLNNERF